MVLILTLINFITIYFFNEERQKYESEIMSAYLEIIKYEKNHPLPPYIKKFGEELKIDKVYSEENFKQYSTTVLFWESLFIIILSYFFYRISSLLSKKEREYEEFLKFFFFVLSHKIGNYLSVIKTNTALLRLSTNLRSIERIERSSQILDEEIKKSIEIIKKIPKISKNKQKIELSNLIEDLLSKQECNKKLIYTPRQLNFEANAEALETIIFLLIDNAFRYSHSFIHIKICKNGLAIRNDFSEILKGSGIGLQIVNYLCKIHKISLIHRAKGNHFLIILNLKG